MISWIFALITLGAVVFASFARDMRRSVLTLWVAGLSIGGLYLTLGAELLAVVQWIVATLVAISFIFFAAMFGEYGGTREKPSWSAALKIGVPVLLGLAFAALVWIGAGMPEFGAPTAAGEGNDLAAIGHNLVANHLISLEVLALTLFLALVGGGIIARPESERGGGGG